MSVSGWFSALASPRSKQDAQYWPEGWPLQIETIPPANTV
jgi:hypothetical protein